MSLEEYRDRLAAEKRGAVLKGAFRVFLDQGYERASIEKIAREAGVSTRTIYKHFENKEALFASLIDEMWENRSVMTNRVPAAGSAEEILRAVGRNYAELMLRDDTQALYRVIIAESARVPELGRALHERENRAHHVAMKKYLKDRESEVLPAANIDAAIDQLLALIGGLLFWPRMLQAGPTPSSGEIDKAVNEAVAVILARYSAS